MKKPFNVIVMLGFSLFGLSMLNACTNAQTATLETPASIPTKKPKIALVLGGGGARGFAHIGVIQALEDNGIRPDIIVGTSSGAIVGALYASGKSAGELKTLALTMDESELIDFTPSKQGLLKGEKIAQFINTQTGGRYIEKLPIRFGAVATQMHTQTATVFTSGDTGQAVQASASVPKLFIPPRIPTNGGKKYIDGGQSALVPAKIAKNMGADIVIAVDVMAKNQPTPTKTPPNQSHATLKKTENGLNVKWGDHDIDLPINFDTLNNQQTADAVSGGFDIGAIMSDVFNKLPDSISIPIPNELADGQLDTGEFWQIFDRYAQTFGANTQINADDLKASDILINPQLGQYSVFNVSEKEGMIIAGNSATLAKMGEIKTLIQNKNP